MRSDFSAMFPPVDQLLLLLIILSVANVLREILNPMIG